MAVSMISDPESEQELAEDAQRRLAMFQDIILFHRQQSLTADSPI